MQIKRSNYIPIFIEKFYAHLFFVFFVAQILSPSVGEKTLYLEIIVALINPFFLFWIKKQPIRKRYFFVYIAILAVMIFGNISLAIKFFTITISVFFLFYSYDKKLFFLKPYIIISIAFAIFQLYFTFFNPELAQLIGPTNISKMIWGNYATATFTNFYTVFWFPRVSGLSREAGFFASFLVAYILFLYLDNKNKHISSSYLYKILLSVGYVVSFSKMSLVLIAVFVLNQLKYLIDKIPFLLTLVVFVLCLMFFWDSQRNYLLEYENITFLHRFGGYASLFDVDLLQLLFGINSPSEINTQLAYIVNEDLKNFAGFSGFILHNGILVVTILLVALYYMGISSTGLIILLLLTINVQLDTNQNFVVLSYFIILKFFSNRRIIFRSSNANN